MSTEGFDGRDRERHERPLHRDRGRRHERHRARAARARLPRHRVRPQELPLRARARGGRHRRHPWATRPPRSTRPRRRSWSPPRPSPTPTPRSSAPASWASPSGRAPRCSRGSRAPSAPSPWPGRTARRRPPRWWPRCSTRWASTRPSSSAASWRAMTPTAATARASTSCARRTSPTASFLYLNPSVVGGHQHRGGPPRPLRHPRESRADLLHLHGPRGRGGDGRG